LGPSHDRVILFDLRLTIHFRHFCPVRLAWRCSADDTGRVSTTAGKVIRLSESDYCFGQGPLTIRLDHVDRANPVRYAGDTWYRVEGVQMTANGIEIGRCEVLVRTRRLSP
jgi:hypothetical protein